MTKKTTLNEPMRAMLTILTDGEWHTFKELSEAASPSFIKNEKEKTHAVGHKIMSRRRTNNALENVPEHTILATGAKELCRNRLVAVVRNQQLEKEGTRYRLPENSPLREQLNTKPTPTAEELGLFQARHLLTPNGKYDPKAEMYFWENCPLESYGRFHFHDRTANFPLDDLRRDYPNHKITYDEVDGVYRMDGPVGEAVQLKQNVSEWCNKRDIIIANRGCKDPIKRRDPKKLDPYFMEKATLFYADLMNRVVGRYQSILDVHFHGTDKELEKQQQIYIWILNAYSMFDHTKGVPFGAFLVRQLSYWVNDLTRQTHSRTIADKENNINKAISKFQHEHGRYPTDLELSEELDLSVEKIRTNRRLVSTVQALRDIKAFETEEGSPEIQIRAEEDTEDQYFDYAEFSEKTALILAGCEDPQNGKHNILGFLTLYLSAYQQETKQSIAEKMSTSPRVLGNAEKDAVLNIKKQLTENE